MTQAAGLPPLRRPRLSPTLSGYIARQYLMWFLGFLFGLVGVIVLVSTVDPTATAPHPDSTKHARCVLLMSCGQE